MLVSIYRKAQFLSLDIVFGAVILLRFFSNQLSVDISFITYSLLAGSVWLIYTIDHIRDAKLSPSGQRRRYQFHLQHEKRLKVVSLFVLLLCIYGVWHISNELFIAGGILALLALIYLLIHPFLSRWGLKEFYVAVIYTVGILLAPFTALKSIEWNIAWLLFLLALTNLILFSWFEKEDDLADNFSSIATVHKNSTLEMVLMVLLSLGFTTVLLLEFNLISFFFIVAFTAYTFLFIKKEWAGKYFRYRSIGDGIFLFPLIFVSSF